MKERDQDSYVVIDVDAKCGIEPPSPPIAASKWGEGTCVEACDENY